MQGILHWPPRLRRERLSVEIVPKTTIDTTIPCPRIHTFFQGCGKLDCSFVSTKDVPEGAYSSPKHTRDRHHLESEDTLMREVADWVELNESDNNWAVRRQHWKNLIPTPSESIAHFTSHIHSQTPEDGPEWWDSLLHLIVIQLLASAYTLCGPPNASHLPFQAIKNPEFITTLRLHSQYRFSPAAGHHARESSAESAWPALYVGPSLEEQIADRVSQKRLLKTREAKNFTLPEQEHEPHAPEWYDGAARSETLRRRASDSSASSVSIHQLGCFPKFKSNQAPVLKALKLSSMSRTNSAKLSRRDTVKTSGTSSEKNSPSNSRRTSHANSGKASGPQSEKTSRANSSKTSRVNSMKMNRMNTAKSSTKSKSGRLKYLASLFLFRSPSSRKDPTIEELRRTRSTDEPRSRPTPPSRRSSSTPTLGTPFIYPYDIPSIRRVSATPTVMTEEDRARFGSSSGRLPIPTWQSFQDWCSSANSAGTPPPAPASRPGLKRGTSDSALQTFRGRPQKYRSPQSPLRSPIDLDDSNLYESEELSEDNSPSPTEGSKASDDINDYEDNVDILSRRRCGMFGDDKIRRVYGKGASEDSEDERRRRRLGVIEDEDQDRSGSGSSTAVPNSERTTPMETVSAGYEKTSDWSW